MQAHQTNQVEVNFICCSTWPKYITPTGKSIRIFWVTAYALLKISSFITKCWTFIDYFFHDSRVHQQIQFQTRRLLKLGTICLRSLSNLEIFQMKTTFLQCRMPPVRWERVAVLWLHTKARRALHVQNMQWKTCTPSPRAATRNRK